MKTFFSNIKKYFKYAIRSARSELKSEVADSYLNWLWWIIEPFCFMLIYVFIFSVVFKNNEEHFGSFVFIGLMMWQFFNRMLSGSVKLISNYRDLIVRIYIPKYILLLAKSFTYLFKMGVSFIVTLILMFFQGVEISWHIILIIPIVIVLYIVSFGCGLLLMHFGVFLNDLGNMMNIFLRMLLYLSGIFYNINERISGTLGYFLLRGNPIAFCMNEARKALLYNQIPSFVGLGFWLLIGIILCFMGIRTIHKNENSYAKVI